MRTFSAVGTFRYFCEIHGAPGGIGMAGAVVVSAKSATPSGGSGNRTTPSPTSGSGSLGPASSTPCASQRRFRIRIRQPGGARIASARVSVNGKPVGVSRLVIDGRLRHTAVVDLRGLGKGTYTVNIVARTRTEQQLRGARTYRTCVEKQIPTGLPPL
jgi:hypothetical protein